MTKAHRDPTFRPLYEQIKILITQSLVSQGTVRKTIDELAAENILMRRQGKGTFVATHTEEHSQYRFLRMIEVSGILKMCRPAKCSPLRADKAASP